MEKLPIKEEEIVMKITVNKPIKTADVINNLIGNLLTQAGGDIADKIHMILTTDSIYLETVGHAAIGYAEETRSVNRIHLSDIKDFSVVDKENDELITIVTNKHELQFTRDNSKENNLASIFCDVMNDFR